jgi:hypothetical protein
MIDVSPNIPTGLDTQKAVLRAEVVCVGFCAQKRHAKHILVET